jgi:hypothetical protein
MIRRIVIPAILKQEETSIDSTASSNNEEESWSEQTLMTMNQ